MADDQNTKTTISEVNYAREASAESNPEKLAELQKEMTTLREKLNSMLEINRELEEGIIREETTLGL